MSNKLIKLSNFLSIKSKNQDIAQWLIDVDKDLQRLFNALNSYIEMNHIRVGSTDNYTDIASDGDISFGGTASFYPRRISQSAEPTPNDGELIIWRDTDDDKTYLIYDDEDVGTRKVELT